METPIETPARKPQVSGLSVRQRRMRRRMLAILREEVRLLHEAGYAPSAIARTLGIATWDARAFCPAPPERARIVRVPEKPGQREKLPDGVVKALMRGRHAAVGGKTDEERAQSLASIAAAYSMRELLDEPGIGLATAMRIELFLEQNGLHLRSDGATPAPPQHPSKPHPARAGEQQQALASRVMRWSARHAGASTLTDAG